MARLRDPAPLAAAWYVLPGDRYDFSWESVHRGEER